MDWTSESAEAALRMTPQPVPRRTGSTDTGVLTTGGGLAFVGDVDRYFKAFDMDTGKVLWSFQTPSGIVGQPVTWERDGVMLHGLWWSPVQAT